MYITAMRVRDDRDKRNGFNVLLHRHGDGSQVFCAARNDAELLRHVTEVEPGQLIRKRLAIVPGGNTVLSYVDLIAPDETPPDAIRHALDEYHEQIAKDPLAPPGRIGSVLVCFWFVSGLKGLELQEYEQLRDQMVALLGEGE